MILVLVAFGLWFPMIARRRRRAATVASAPPGGVETWASGVWAAGTFDASLWEGDNA